MHLSASFKEFLPKSKPPGTREQGGVEHFCKPNGLGTGSAKPPSTRAAPSPFSSRFLFPERLNQGGLGKKKKKSELDSTLIARNIIKWVDES